MLLQKGKILNNRYRIKGRLGQGGFGAVYLADDLEKGETCAVKENLDVGDDTLGKFLREASILYNLKHPGLPAVWDHFVIPGEGQYLVMEFVEGVSLIEIIEEEGKPLSEEDAVTVLIQVCDALQYLHNQNPPIIHRDIKPGNIRITPEGRVVLVDFGIAKVYDEFSRTSTLARAVSPGYSPLEQYGLAMTDARSDVYALGATAYKLLTNKVPDSSVDIAAGTVPPLKPVHDLNPQVSQEVSTAIARAMRLRLDQRTNSITQFKTELQQSPIHRKSNKGKRSKRIAKRKNNWLAVAFGIVLILAALLTSAYLVYALLPLIF
ncbi:MAG: serine/threonine protein kinase [Anaerolineales bacterium]|nr:serine/threonine protein kinase [Anaerolineales bacterium]